MKKVLLFLLALVSFSLYAQQRILGVVFAEQGIAVPQVLVVNMATNERTYTNASGEFSIIADANTELRFIKKNYERSSVILQPIDFSKKLSVKMQLKVEAIAEVEIGFKPTGNLSKDSKMLEESGRVTMLNNDIKNSFKNDIKETRPSNQMPSTLVLGPNYKAGQVSLLSFGGGKSGGIVGSLISAFKKSKNEPSYADRQNFYNRVKQSVDLNDYYKYGLDDYAFERLLAYADLKFDLTKNFQSNFKIGTIEMYIKSAMKDFLDTKKIKS